MTIVHITLTDTDQDKGKSFRMDVAIEGEHDPESPALRAFDEFFSDLEKKCCMLGKPILYNKKEELH